MTEACNIYRVFNPLGPRQDGRAFKWDSAFDPRAAVNRLDLDPEIWGLRLAGIQGEGGWTSMNMMDPKSDIWTDNWISQLIGSYYIKRVRRNEKWLGRGHVISSFEMKMLHFSFRFF